MKAIFNTKVQVVNRSLLACISRTSSPKTTAFNSSNLWISKRNFQSSFILKQQDQTNSTSKNETTHFGYQTIDAEKKPEMVANVFHKVAEKYDIMNDVMSGGIHRLWKQEFMSVLHPTPGTHLLDVAGGTGDIAFRFVEAVRSSPLYHPLMKHPSETSTKGYQSPYKTSKVVVCDYNPSMIEVGKDRAKKHGYLEDSDPSLSWVVGDAENLPFKDNTFDCYTISFGIRNCTHIDKVLKEAFRVLKKGGRFLCLEFSHIETVAPFSAPLQALYDAYSFNVIPTMGSLVAGDRDSYQYLVESIRKFPNQSEFCGLIEQAGFQLVSYKNLSFGVAAIHSGFKM